MIAEVVQQIPWAVNLIQFIVMSYIIIRVVKVLDNALARAQEPKASLPVSAPQAPSAVHLPSPPTPPAPVPVDTSAVDQRLVDFIKKQEGFTAKAFWDFKQYTNGYGTKALSSTEVVTTAVAEQRLRTEIALADKLVTAKFPNLPKGLHQALIDLTYNAGPGWEEQSLGAAVKAGKMDTIKADIMLYTHAGGQVLEGLVKRRQAEVAMIDNPL